MATARGFREQPWRRRLSRRLALKVVALSGSALADAIGLGCAADEKPRTVEPPVAAQPKRGGILNRAGGQGGSQDTQGVALDPHVNIHATTRTFRLFYQGLLAYDLRTYEVIPELAQKWEQPSETEYLLTLQPNVKWHNKPPANGRPLTIDDVIFSLERARTNDPRILTRSLIEAVDKIEAADRNTLRLTTKAPNAPMLSSLASNQLLVLAPEVVESAGRFAGAETAVGTGAFILHSLEQNIGGRYVRNPVYWKPGLPYLDEVRTLHFNDEETAWAAFLAGQADIVRVPGTEAKKYIAQQGPGYTPLWFNNDTSLQAVVNVRTKPLDDPRVYRALRLLHDHEEMIKAWAEVSFGRGRNGSLFTTAMEAWDLSHEEYYRHLEWKHPKDEAARTALELLRAAGYSRENPLRFELGGVGGARTIIELLQAQWRRLSQGTVDAQLRVYDTPTANNVLANRSFAYMVTGRSGGTDDPDSALTLLFRTGGSRNYGGFSDPVLDAMIDRQRTILDVQQRKALVREIIVYTFDHVADTLPANYYVLNAIKPQVRNFAPENFLNGRQYESIWLDT